MKNKIFILLDRSGSMASMWNEAIGGINGYVKSIKNAEIMLATFDTNSYDVIRNTTTEEWKDFTIGEVFPRGGTPLLDSAGRIMWNMMDSKADRAILVIVTDGEENNSKKFSKQEIKNLTKHITETLDYELVFLGANFDKIGDVAIQNFNMADSSRFRNASVGGFAASMTSTSIGTSSYFDNGKAQNFYNDSDKEKAKV